MSYKLEIRLRDDLNFLIGQPPYYQVHAHSTGNTASIENEVLNQINNRPVAFANMWVGDGRVVQTARLNAGAYDVGGGYNFETYCAVELREGHASYEDFHRDYMLYCEVLYDMAIKAGVPYTVDEPGIKGIKTHNWCRLNQPDNGTDHTDPMPYLTQWGITLEQFRKDVASFANAGGKPSSALETTKKEEPEEELDMTEFAFAFKGAIYYVTGQKMRALKNATEWNVLQAMYKQTHNGRPIVALDWTNNVPTANAYFSICGLGEDAAFQNRTTQGIEDIKKALQ